MLFDVKPYGMVIMLLKFGLYYVVDEGEPTMQYDE